MAIGYGMATLRIVKILSVVDTRAYQEVGDDQWAPIPGSGLENECHRCGRLHEVHATVLLEDKSEVVVGTGCMTAETSEVAAQMKSQTSAAKTLKRQEAQRAGLKAKIDAYKAIEDEVKALPVPPVVSMSYTSVLGRTPQNENAVIAYVEGSPENERATICWDGVVTQERKECAIYGWREWQMRLRGAKRVYASLHDIDRRIARTKAKLAQLSAVEVGTVTA